MQKNQIAKAIKDFKRIVEIDPKDIRHRQKLAELLSRAKMNDEALEQYEAVAKYYFENGFYLKAIAVYKQMQKVDPSQVKYYHRLAELNEKQGLLGNALSEYRNLVAYYEKNQMTSEAIEVLQKMKELEPENLNVLVKIAEAYALTGLKDRSRDEFEAVLESLTGKRDYAKVVKLCEMFTRFFPDDQMLQVRSAEALINSDQAEKGVEQLGALPKALQNTPEVLRALANGYDKLGKHDEESSLRQRLLDQNPDDIDLQQGYVEACLKADQFQVALDCLEERIDPFLGQGRVVALKDFYEVLQEKLPDNAQVKKTLQAIYERTGNGDKLFDLMSDEDAPRDPVAADTQEALETLDDALLKSAVDDLEEAADTVFPDVTGALSDEPETDDLPELKATVSDKRSVEVKGEATSQPSADFDESAEVSLDFLEDVVQQEPVPASVSHEDPESELELDLELDPDVLQEIEIEEVVEEVVPEAEIEEVIEEVVPEAEIEEVVPAVDVESELEEAEFYLQQGLYREAAESCRKILDFDPNNVAARQKLADLEERRGAGKFSQEVARAGVDEQTQIDAGTGDEEFDWDAAGEETLTPIQDDIDSEDAESHFNLGIAYKEMGLLDDAVNELSSAMRHHSRRFDALILKGVCLAEKGDTETAEQVLAEGLSMPGLNEPERVSLNFELGLLKEANGELESALKLFSEVARVDHFFRDVGVKIKHLKETLGISESGLDENQSPTNSKNKVSYL